MIPTLRLVPRASKLARKGRPWFWRDDLATDPEPPDAAELVAVADDAGRPLGLGFWSPRSKLALRLAGGWSGDTLPEPCAFFAERLAAAVARRGDLAGAATGVRLVHGEADGLPGLVVDRYADVIVLQVGSALVERHLDAIVPWLAEHLAPRMVLARDDTPVRALEGLESRIRMLHGQRVDEVWIDEGGVRHPVAPWTGHKTGFYLDQRPARAYVQAHARGRRMLDAFGYQGAFSLHALAGGARTALLVEQSADAIRRAHAAAARNALTGLDAREGNAFTVLRDLRRAGETFDLMVVDPPAFAKRRRELDGALRGYRDLNRLALRLLAPGGLLVTCSCSHHLDLPTFEALLRQAAADLPFRCLLRARLGAGPDHPAWLSLPESEYLKVLVVERQP